MHGKTVITRLLRQGGVLLTLGASALLAGAQTGPAAAPAPKPELAPPRIGEATQHLLSLQRSASGPDRPIPGAQASLSYRRYLDTFKHPIPERTGSNISGITGDKAH